MLNKSLVIEVLNNALLSGADFCEVYYEEATKKFIQVENLKTHDYNKGMQSGVGIRVIKGLRSVYGHTNDVSKESLLKLSLDLSKSFEGTKIKTVDDLVLQKIKRVNKKINPYLSVKDDDIIDLLKNTSSKIYGTDERIVKFDCAFLIEVKDITIYNSDNKMFKDHREHGRLILQSVAFKDGKIETRFDAPGTQKGFEYFTQELDVDSLAKNHKEKLLLMLEAKECPSGKFPVVIGNGWGGVIFHEACGHQLEATSVAKKISVYSDLYNKKIGNECVTAYDDGTMANEWGSNNIDDEGYPTKKNLLIEKGILKGYLVDPFGSRRMEGFKPTGCSRRESYKYEPTSRMSNTYIANGKSTKEEIIKATKLGIYAVSFNGGSVDPSTGDFNFGCSEAYLIKDGKIDMPLRGATLIGKATEILNHIDMVANDLALGQGNCGSSSGYVQTNVGQPTIRVDEITVGGRGGNINEL